MLHRLVALSVVLAASCSALAQDPPATPTWKDMMERGIAPHRQLTLDDFPVDDSVHANFGFFVKPAIEPRYHFMIKPHSGFAYAYVDQWLVFSGLDKKQTSRRSKFKMTKDELPYAQALLNISEIYARQLAALKTGELPNARGNTFEEARAEIQRKMTELIDARFNQAKAEMEAFAKATKNGADKKKVRQLAAEIRKRLDATPASTVPFGDTAAAPGPVAASPTPTGTAGAAPAASGTPAPAATPH